MRVAKDVPLFWAPLIVALVVVFAVLLGLALHDIGVQNRCHRLGGVMIDNQRCFIVPGSQIVKP